MIWPQVSIVGSSVGTRPGVTVLPQKASKVLPMGSSPVLYVAVTSRPQVPIVRLTSGTNPFAKSPPQTSSMVSSQVFPSTLLASAPGNRCGNTNCRSNGDCHGNTDYHGNTDCHGYIDCYGSIDCRGSIDRRGFTDCHSNTFAFGNTSSQDFPGRHGSLFCLPTNHAATVHHDDVGRRGNCKTRSAYKEGAL